MKNRKELILSIVLIVVCVLVSSLFNKKSEYIHYTFFMKNDNNYNLYDSNGKKLLDDNLIYAERFNDDYTLIVNEKNECAIIDKNGNFIINYGEYDKIEEYGRLYLAYKGEDIILITGNNKLIRKVEDKKELVSNIVHNYAVLLYDGNYNVYNSNGDVIFSRKYKKKKQLILKESTNYGLIYYDGKEYLFNINSTEYEERDTKIVSDIEEFYDILLVTGETNRVYYEKQRVIDDIKCAIDGDKPKIDGESRILCSEEVIYEPDYLKTIKDYKTIDNYGEYFIACNEKCDLFRKNEKILKNYDEIKIIKTNINDYFYVKKGKNNIILNNEYKTVYSSIKDIKLEKNYINVNNKLYTFDGNEINI